MIKKLTVLSILLFGLCGAIFAISFTPRSEYNSGWHNKVSINSTPVLEGRYKYGDDASSITPSNVIIFGDAFFVARDRGLFAYSFSSSKLLWQTTIPNSRALSNTIMLINDSIVVANDRSIVSYDPATGAANWTYKSGDKLKGLPPYDSKYLYVLTNRLDLVSLENGVSEQNMRVNNITASVPPVLRGSNNIVVLGTNGKMSRFESGALKWNGSLPNRKGIALEAVSNIDSIFVQSEGTIYSLNVNSNTAPVRWELTRSDIFNSSDRRNIVDAKMSTTTDYVALVTTDGKLV